MVVGAFPAAKLAVLAFKQLSKPIANVLKERAKTNPFFRQYICMPPAQFYNWVEIKTKMWTLNLGKPVNVPQLNEAMAIDLGANLLGEVIIFTIGAGLLIFEYVRQSNKETRKEELIVQEKQELINTLNDLSFRLEKQSTQIRELNRTVADLESRSWLPKKLKILGDRSEPPPPSPPPPAAPKSSVNNMVSGNYNPNSIGDNNFTEHDDFYREQKRQTLNTSHYGVVQNALVYLNFGVYK